MNKKISLDYLTVIASSVVYLLYTLMPFKKWLRLNNYRYEPFPDINIYSDSIYYLGQIREVINGNYSIGNPIIFENATDGFSYGNSSLFFIWGTIGRVLELNLIQTYLLMVCVNSLALVLVLNAFYRMFYVNKIAIYLSLLLCLWLIGPLGRPSPTQQLLPILLLTLILLLNQNRQEKSSKRFNINMSNVTFACCALILVLGNQFYSVFLAVLVVVSSIVIKKVSYFHFFTVIILNGFYFVWTKIKLMPADNEIAERLGLHYTHLPGALVITLPLLILIAINTLLLFSSHFKKFIIKNNSVLPTKVYLVLNSSLLIALNSQIFTGIALEMEAHFLLVWYVLLGLNSCALLNYILEAYQKVKWIKIAEKLSFISIIFVVIIYANQFNKVQLNSSERTYLLEEISNKNNIESVLIKANSEFSDLSDEVIALTDSYLYWEPFGKFSKMSKEDIISRFACTNVHLMDYKEFLKSEIAAPSRQIVNSIMQIESYNRFLRLFGVERTNLNFSNPSVDKYQIYVRKQQECSRGEFQFRVDKIID